MRGVPIRPPGARGAARACALTLALGGCAAPGVGTAPDAGTGPDAVTTAYDRSGTEDIDPPPARAAEVAAGVEAAPLPPRAWMDGRTTAFHYGGDLPLGALSLFDRVVVEPEHVDRAALARLHRGGAAVYARVSVGELDPDPDPDHDARMPDPADRHETVPLAERIDALVATGYDGLFLDALDGYLAEATTPAVHAGRRDALVAFVRSTAARHPALGLIAHHGLEVLDAVAPALEAIVAGPLYASWDEATGRYGDVTPGDRERALARLGEARERHALDVVVIDFVPPGQDRRARDVAARIAAHGFVPWVTSPTLERLGTGLLESVPREVLMLFDSRVNNDQSQAEVHKLLAMPLEYHGRVPVYLDVATAPLPTGDLGGRYAGIVSWTPGAWDVPGIAAWYARQIDAGVPLAMFGAPPFDPDAAAATGGGGRGGAGSPTLGTRLGLRTGLRALDPATASVRVRDALIGHEREPRRRPSGVPLVLASSAVGNDVHLGYTDARGTRADLVVTGDWGGLALHPAAALVDVDDLFRWVVDPFAFLVRALRLEDAPMPDVTTENGRRLWFAHIDGDALPSWAEMPGRRLGAEVIRERILERYPLPHTVSVVEGEMRALATVADRRARMFDVARDIFALPTVAVASHSYSHPFDWRALAAAPAGAGAADRPLNLPIPGYVYSPEREVAGSVAFIDATLAPPGKRTGVFLWSGDALPDAAALASVERAGLVNLNGGTTSITRAAPWLALVDPMARVVDGHVQVYAPVTNENIFTNEWSGPFDGFRRVIETFEMTERPRRLKPIDVYYHFYAGTKIASLRSLEEVYDWSVAAQTLPVHAVDYVRKVPDFRRAAVARFLGGGWKVGGLGEVRSLRFTDVGPSDAGHWPAMTDARGLAGARALHDGLYVHTDGADTVVFDTVADAPVTPYLVSANGRLERWRTEGSGLRFRIRGHVPVVVELGGTALAGCTLSAAGRRVAGTPTDAGMRYAFATKDTGDVALDCHA